MLSLERNSISNSKAYGKNGLNAIWNAIWKKDSFSLYMCVLCSVWMNGEYRRIAKSIIRIAYCTNNSSKWTYDDDHDDNNKNKKMDLYSKALDSLHYPWVQTADIAKWACCYYCYCQLFMAKVVVVFGIDKNDKSLDAFESFPKVHEEMSKKMKKRNKEEEERRMAEKEEGNETQPSQA